MPSLKAGLKLFVFLTLTLAMIPLQVGNMLVTKGKKARTLPVLWARLMCRIFGINITINGRPVTDGQCIFIANHLSYLDIPAIGSQIDAAFVAKQEVASWPLFGLLAKLRQSVFIDRSPSAVRTETGNFAHRLQEDGNMILFPEGTSSNGQDVLPFKSSIFAPVIAQALSAPQELILQPVAIRLTSVKKSGVRQENLPDHDLYAWYGDDDLAPHLWRFAKTGGVHLNIDFLEPVRPEGFDRKSLAHHCRNAILQRIHSPILSLENTLPGRQSCAA